jgi:cytochrome c oxidase subunit III
MIESTSTTNSRDKGDILVPGAGTFGMAVLVISLTTLFAASMAAYLFIRSRTPNWGLAMPPVPRTLWLSTAVILLASVAIQRAHGAVRRGHERRLRRNLAATFIIGVVFLLLQTFNWWEFYGAIRHIDLSGAYLGMFFVLTGLHAAHVVGGLIPLGVVMSRAGRGRYSPNYHPGVRYLAIYWHFLDAIWVVLFGVLYF